MADSFMHKHQASLDSQREEAQDIAVGEPFRVESYVEVEEAEEDWV